MDAPPPPCRPPGSRRELRRPRPSSDREPRAPPAACRPPAEESPAPPSRHRRLPLAGSAPLVDPMGGGARHRAARNRHALAARRLQTVGAWEIAAPRWRPEHNGRHPRSRLPDGGRELVEGRATPSRRDPEARPCRLCGGRRVVAERVFLGVALPAAISASRWARPSPMPSRVPLAPAFTEASVVPTRGCDLGEAQATDGPHPRSTAPVLDPTKAPRSACPILSIKLMRPTSSRIRSPRPRPSALGATSRKLSFPRCPSP